MGSPPLRLAAPIVALPKGGGCTKFTICATEIEEGMLWLGVYDLGHCTYFNVTGSKSHGSCVIEAGDTGVKNFFVKLVLIFDYFVNTKCLPLIRWQQWPSH